jgi:hypothetical protein
MIDIKRKKERKKEQNRKEKRREGKRNAGSHFKDIKCNKIFQERAVI